MILKLIGSMIVLFSTTLMGMLLARNYKLRLSSLKDIHRCLEYLMSQIVYLHAPLPEALVSTAAIASKDVAPVFSGVVAILEKEENCSVGQAFIKALNGVNLPLDREDVKIIENLANNLGCTDVENQVRSFKLALSELSRQEEVALRLKEKNEKLFKEIGFLSGAVIVILLI